MIRKRQGSILSAAMEQAEVDLSKLLELLLGACSNADRHSGIDKKRPYVLGFAFKLLHHAASALTLLRTGSATSEQHQPFVDRSSTCVLARAGWESFLLFHHIYVAATDEDEREVRYLRWLIESPRKRQRFTAQLRGQSEQLEIEKHSIQRVEASISENPAYLRMSAGAQKDFLRADRDGRWKPGWSKIAAEANIAKEFAEDHYSYLCDHAHSGWFSLTALNSPMSSGEEQLLRTTVAGILAVAVANMIAGLGQLIPSFHEFVGADDDLLVEKWVRIGRESTWQS